MLDDREGCWGRDGDTFEMWTFSLMCGEGSKKRDDLGTTFTLCLSVQKRISHTELLMGLQSVGGTVFVCARVSCACAHPLCTVCSTKWYCLQAKVLSSSLGCSLQLFLPIFLTTLYLPQGQKILREKRDLFCAVCSTSDCTLSSPPPSPKWQVQVLIIKLPFY